MINAGVIVTSLISPHTNSIDGKSSDMSESSSDKTKQTSASKKRPVSDPSSNESKCKKRCYSFARPIAKLGPALAHLQKETTWHFASYAEQILVLAMGSKRHNASL